MHQPIFRCARPTAVSLLILLVMTACVQSTAASRTRAVKRSPAVTPLVDEVQERTFRFFWDLANPANGLIPDRAPTPSFSSIAAVGFGLTTYPIGVERGWITREAATERVLTTLRFFRDARQGSESTGITGHRGFFYHFVDMDSGVRFKTVELSTIDTALLMAGALFCQSYFDRNDPKEQAIRDTAEEIYRRVEWTWVQPRAPIVGMGWTPENGFIPYDYRGYNEAMILYILALGSPTHPVDPAAWTEFVSTNKWETFYGETHVPFAPLFGHQYSHVWIDFRGIQDAFMKEKGIDYFENSRRAVVSQRKYAIDNPMKWKGYGANVWGLTASDGPLDGTVTIEGSARTFYTYRARGAASDRVEDDGTIAPTAAVSSIAFSPELAIPAIETMHSQYGKGIYSTYGFLDAFNPTLTRTDVTLQHGSIHPDVGWVDGDYLGIDQGPIVAMIENFRTGLVWETMKKNPHVVRGLRRAGFTGGWLEKVP